MHYYKRNLGDYYKKAGRLSMLQHGAYTLLLDSCYDREEFPTFEQAICWCWASSKDEVEAVKFVLTRFFEERKLDDGSVIYVQKRIENDLKSYWERSQKNAEIARERERKKRERKRVVHETCLPEHETCSKQHERAPNQEPITINQEPIKKTTQKKPCVETSKTKRFVPPDLIEVQDYFFEKTQDWNFSSREAIKFQSHYESNGWKVGKNKMKNWQSAITGWISRAQTSLFPP